MWIVNSAAIPVDPLVAPIVAPIDDAIGEAPIPASMDADEEAVGVVGDPGDELDPCPEVPQALAPMMVAAPIRARARR
ncbi:hypothetical protein [Pseudarthrobacter sp. H2]|uniref:hypothetical protein n=1 Tax=Pseudarthrobacter sp. H2 TaxID=3418415 RepID=UPI003CF2088F